MYRYFVYSFINQCTFNRDISYMSVFFISLLSVNLLLSYCSFLFYVSYYISVISIILCLFLFLFSVFSFLCLSSFFYLCCCNIIVTGVRFLSIYVIYSVYTRFVIYVILLVGHICFYCSSWSCFYHQFLVCYHFLYLGISINHF